MATTTLYSGTRRTDYPGYRTLRGEYIDYTFPLSIVPLRYEIGFSEDAWPIRWYLFGRLRNGPWALLDSRINYTSFNTIDPQFTPYANTISYDLSQKATIDSIRLHVSVSTAPHIKLREFKIYDQFGENLPFLVPFCTNTNTVHPSGSLNFSRIDSFSLDANLPADFYAVGHSILEIENGMCTNVI